LARSVKGLITGASEEAAAGRRVDFDAFFGAVFVFRLMSYFLSTLRELELAPEKISFV
jgi:hypothetical protein